MRKRSKSDGWESEKDTSKLTESESKNLVGRLFVAWGELEFKASVFFELLRTADYDIPDRTVRNWRGAVEKTDVAISENKQSGRQKALTDEQLRLFVGWTLDKNKKNEPVHLVDAKMFIFDTFSIEVTEMTVSNYYRDLGFRIKKVTKRSGGFEFDVDTLIEKGLEWLRKQDLIVAKSQLVSLDFTYTSHRTRTNHGYGAIGGVKLNENAPLSRFTNVIVTSIWADGVDRTPSVMFSYNSQFKLVNANNKLQKEKLVYLKEQLHVFKVEEHRVVYLKDLAGNSKTFVRESPEILKRFFEIYEIEPDCVILHDAGTAFSEGGEIL